VSWPAEQRSDLIYIAGPSKEIPRCRKAAEYAQSLGWTISLPWWELVEEARRNGFLNDEDIPDARAREVAKLDLAAIDRSRRVVVLCKEQGGLSSGACGELLYAVAISTWQTPPPLVCIVGKPKHIFGSLVPVYATIEEAILSPKDTR
jgi:hypothetical protein